MPNGSPERYETGQVAAGFAALGSGREKNAIGGFIREFAERTRASQRNASVAVVLGVGTGWELRLVGALGFGRIVGYEPAATMLGEARKLVFADNLQGIELYDDSGLPEMRERWASAADLVLGTHVIPALATRAMLLEHFQNYREFLKSDGFGLAITNNPQDQFLDYPTYSCHHLGGSVADGDPVLTRLKDVVSGGEELIGANGDRHTVGGETLAVEDTFWSDPAIRDAIRRAGLILTDLHYIRLRPMQDLAAPYLAYSCRKPRPENG